MARKKTVQKPINKATEKVVEKAAEKAAEKVVVKEAAVKPVTTEKAIVKETVAKPALEKTTAKQTVIAGTLPEKKTSAKTTPVKTTEKKKPGRKPIEPDVTLYIQHHELEITTGVIIENVKSAYAALGEKARIKNLEVYIKPAEAKVYYVVNGNAKEEYVIGL
ncbi:MAG: DUF6465 family protein [Ruminococcus sp.]|jgi:hypothetical protein|nr:DUF6465 family protein [Ruminococcus sp.]